MATGSTLLANGLDLDRMSDAGYALEVHSFELNDAAVLEIQTRLDPVDFCVPGMSAKAGTIGNGLIAIPKSGAESIVQVNADGASGTTKGFVACLGKPKTS